MSILVINNNILISTRPLLKKLADYGRGRDFEEVVEGLESSDVVTPDDYFHCVLRGMRQSGITFVDLKHALIDYLSTTSDPHLIYNELAFPYFQEQGYKFTDAIYGQPLKVDTPGDTLAIVFSEIIFPSGPIYPIDGKNSSLFSINGFNPSCEGGGRIEITHIAGFNGKKQINLPAHFQDEEGNFVFGILRIGIELPKRPEKLLKIDAVIEDKVSTTIDIGKLGLIVPNGDETFSTKVMYANGGICSYYYRPRFINGMFIEPKEMGQQLEINLATEEITDERIIITRLFDKTSLKPVPVKLTVRVE